MTVMTALWLGAGAAGASTVGGATFALSSPSASGSAITYSASFRATTALTAGTDTVTLQAPAGTGWPTPGYPYCYYVTDPATGFGGCGLTVLSGAGNTTATITVPGGVNIGAGDPVTVRVGDVTNPAGAGPKTLQLSTSQDATPVTLRYRITREASVSRARLSLTSSGAGASEVNYAISFVSPGRLDASGFGTASTVTLTAPAGTVFPAAGANQYQCFDATIQLGICNGDGAQVGGAGNQVTIPIGRSNPGDLISIHVSGVTNPNSTGSETLTLTTSSDPRPVALRYTLVAPQSVSDPFLNLSSYTAGASGTTWSLGFVAPQRLTGGGLYAGSDSTITIAAPAGTVLPSAGLTCWDATTLATNACGSVTLSNGSATMTIGLGQTTDPGDVISIVIPGVTNPATMGTVALSTSSDTQPVTMPLSAATTPAALAQLSTNSASTATQATQAVYALTFASAATLVDGVSTLTISGPAGTVFPACAGGAGQYVLLDDTTGSAVAISASCASPAQTMQIMVNGGTVSAGDVLTLAAFGVANPTSTGAQTLQLTGAAGSYSFGYTLGGPTAVAAPLLQSDSRSASAPLVSYTASFTAVGGFPSSSFANWSSVMLNAAAGTSFTANCCDTSYYSLFNLTTGTGTAGGSVGGSPNVTIVPGSGDGFWAAAGDQIAVNAQEVANPASRGGATMGIATAGDPNTAGVRYFISRPTAVGTPMLQLSSFTGGASGVTYALTFRATSGLVPDFSTITLGFPTGTDLSNATYAVTDDTTGAASGATAQLTGGEEVITPGTGADFEVAPGDVVTVLVQQVTNPSSGSTHLTLSTSTDPGVKTIGYALQ